MSCTITVIQLDSYAISLRENHSGARPMRSCVVVVIRGLLLPGRVRRGALRFVACIGRLVAQGLHVGSRGGVVGLQRALARLVEDDAGVDEKADKGGAREGGKQQMLATWPQIVRSAR